MFIIENENCAILSEWVFEWPFVEVSRIVRGFLLFDSEFSSSCQKYTQKICKYVIFICIEYVKKVSVFVISLCKIEKKWPSPSQNAIVNWCDNPKMIFTW